MDSPEYKPHPLDTAQVELSDDLQANVEALARNNHEVWASNRASEGWKPGPYRDDARKQHPSLVPYDELSEGEKEIDRATVEQTLKTAVVLGFEIRRRAPGKRPAPSAERKAEPDDMREWPHWPKGLDVDVLAKLEQTRQAIADVYDAANRQAQFNLMLHKWIAPVVVLCGTATVVMGILQLYGFGSGAASAEAIFALTSVVLVLCGVIGDFKRRWLVRRHRAERCRFLKFNFLLEVASANRQRERLLRGASDFIRQAQSLEPLEYPKIEEWLEEDQVLQNPPDVHETASVLADLSILAEHYARTRLTDQYRYFANQAEQQLRKSARYQGIPVMFFGASVYCVGAHYAIHLWWEKLEPVGHYLLLSAALLPVFGYGIRGMQSIFEYSRNTLRFTAKRNALHTLITELEDEMSKQPTVHRLQHLLWKGEQILEGEHREWLRLMMETEWIG